MNAELLFHQRILYDDGGIVEMVIWRVPSPVPPAMHDLKYSLFYGRPGVREVGYDNERGKGDHRHIRGAETPYAFTSVEQLMVDFWSDVQAVRGEQMNDVKITVGGEIEKDAARRFVDAWHRAERGETFHERHLVVRELGRAARY